MSEPNFDNTQAFDEGWGIFDCDGSENGPWQIQRIDNPEDMEPPPPYAEPVFLLDDHAWDFVRREAAKGSAYHKAALDFICEHNPQEYNLIMQRAA
ncbi:MAG: hypothetical protein ACK4TP_07950 [Hyphomicrobium sp.]